MMKQLNKTKQKQKSKAKNNNKNEIINKRQIYEYLLYTTFTSNTFELGENIC